MSGTASTAATDGRVAVDPPFVEDGPPGCAICVAVLVWVALAAVGIRVARRLLTRRPGRG